MPTELAPLIDDAVRTMRAQTESANQTLTERLDPNLPRVDVEPGRIRQILVNLLTNAHEYSPERASVVVSARVVGAEVEIAVTDNGPGIPENQLQHIFERFTRGDAGLTQRVGGTGLGLAISKSLVELHGGTIEAATARVRLDLLCPSPRALGVGSRAPTADGRRADGHVLVATRDDPAASFAPGWRRRTRSETATTARRYRTASRKSQTSSCRRDDAAQVGTDARASRARAGNLPTVSATKGDADAPTDSRSRYGVVADPFMPATGEQPSPLSGDLQPNLFATDSVPSSNSTAFAAPAASRRRTSTGRIVVVMDFALAPAVLS
jgi:hypothetical protein